MTTHDRKDRRSNRAHQEHTRNGYVREALYDGLGRVAEQRAGGQIAQLKGVVHEVMYAARKNASPRAVLFGETTRLTENPTAQVVDVVTMRGGKVIERAQLKDVISAAGQSKTAKQIASGKYDSVRMVGTEETVKGLRDRGVTREVRSSGVSSDTTARIADNRGARSPSKNVLEGNLRDIGRSAGNAAVVSGVMSGALETYRGVQDVRSGARTKSEVAVDVVCTAGKSAATAGVKTGAALLAKEGFKAAAKSTGSQTLRRAAGSNPATAVAFAAAEVGMDAVAYAAGKIDGRELGRRSSGSVGSMSGAIAGAAIGSVVPGVGTVIGGVAGGLAGGGAGRWIGSKLFG